MKRILIANRGEVARRIIRACRQLDIESVALFSDGDSRSPHTEEADLALRLPGLAAEDTYLNQSAVLEAAAGCGADAVHPGFGFLAENDRFAAACAAAKVKFIGPPVETMRIAGDKGRARAAAAAAAVPIIPGSDSAINTPEDLQRAAGICGYPLLLKAAAGGGGKGMRRVNSAAELEAAAEMARREAARAFGDDRLIVERDIAPARHVEVQLLGDCRGKIVHLFERECSFQRRFQKIIEESPAPGIPLTVKKRLFESALALGRAIGLQNAATVEFLLPLNPQPNAADYFFIEINPRLQVEHPVTEALTGIDIVAWQLRIARGEAIDFESSDINPPGHAIEARIYAEVPEDRFLPAVGAIRYFSFPAHSEFSFAAKTQTEAGAAQLRIDHGLRRGLEISTRYDPMIGKIIARAADRRQAVKELSTALNSVIISGVDTNIPFLSRVLALPAPVDITYLDRNSETAAGNQPPGFSEFEAAAIAAVIQAASGKFGRPGDPFFEAALWRDVPLARSRAAAELTISINSRPLRYNGVQRLQIVWIKGRTFLVSPLSSDAEAKELQPIEIVLEPDSSGLPAPIHGIVSIGSRSAKAAWIPGDRPVESIGFSSAGCLVIGGYQVDCMIRRGREPVTANRASGRKEAAVTITAPIPGIISAIKTRPDAEVEAGQTLCIIESMKMEHPIQSPCTGKVAAIEVRIGLQVQNGAVLIRLAPKNF